jgi:hypothetical protein
LKTQFEPLKNFEVLQVLAHVYNAKAEIRGKISEGPAFPIKISHRGNSVLEFKAQHRFKGPLPEQSEAVLSLVWEKRKLFFKAIVKFVDRENVDLTFTTEFYAVQRRILSRIYLPKDYECVFKVTHINERFVRYFGKVIDIHQSGAQIEFPFSTPLIKAGDLVKGTISLKNWAKEAFSLKITHNRVRPGNKIVRAGQLCGGAFVQKK